MSRNGTSQAGVSRPGPGPDVIVFGQIARDLVLVVDAVPTASRSADVYQRRELLGGKGANQAAGMTQLGLRPALAGVVGEDQVGQRLLTQASQDRVDVSAVARRPGLRTEDCRDTLLDVADVVRADAREAGLLAGSPVTTAAEAEKAAAELLRQCSRSARSAAPSRSACPAPAELARRRLRRPFFPGSR